MRASNIAHQRSFKVARRGGESVAGVASCVVTAFIELSPFMSGAGGYGTDRQTSSSNAAPYTSAPTTKVITVKPSTRCTPMPAIATTGAAQNGCSMLETCSPMATAIVVAGTDACSAIAAGTTNGPCTAQ